MKKALIGLIVLVVLGVIAAAVLLSNVGPIVKRAVEDVGSRATGAPVTLQEVEFSLSSGTGAMRTLVIGNPEGFNTPSAFEMAEISITLDTASLTTDTVIIKQVVVAGPQVTYEVGVGRTNIGTIQANVSDFVASLVGGGDGTPAEGDTAGDSDGGGKKIIIEQLHFQDGQVSVSATFLGGKKASLPLPEIHMTDIGKESDGATPGEIAGEVLGELSRSVLDAVSKSSIDGLGDTVDQIKKTGESITKGAEKAIKGLFGGDDK